MERDTGPLREVWTIFDGLPLLYRTNATPVAVGARTIVHIHGFAISGRYLMPTASLLAPDYRTFVPDLPGFGRSLHPRRPLTIDRLGDAVVRFMDHVGVERAILLSNSLGAPITGAVIDTHPDRVEAAVLVSPAGGRYNLPVVKGVAQMALAGTREPLGMLPIALRDYSRFGVRPSLNLLRSMLAYPAAQRIREFRLPTLVVIGSRDPLVGERHISSVAIELPNVTAVVIEGAAHAINFSHPDQLAHVVRCWLEGRPIVGDPFAKGTIRVFETIGPARSGDA
jgi:pimeloyl-ACP methyl ester carboxylesterase